MRVFVQGSMAAMLFVASILSMMDGQFLAAGALVIGALVFGWHVFAAKAWADWGEAGAIMDVLTVPAGADEDERNRATPFDPDAALANYLQRKAAGEVEPLADPVPQSVPGARFGRKAR